MNNRELRDYCNRLNEHLAGLTTSELLSEVDDLFMKDMVDEKLDELARRYSVPPLATEENDDDYAEGLRFAIGKSQLDVETDLLIADDLREWAVSAVEEHMTNYSEV